MGTTRDRRSTAHGVYGDAVAILAGDALLTHAFGVLARPESTETPARQARRLRAMARLADAAGAAGMVGGQILDIGATDDRSSGRSIPHVGHTALRDIHERKTGALIGAAAAMGAILAGGDEETLAASWGSRSRSSMTSSTSRGLRASSERPSARMPSLANQPTQLCTG